MKIRSLILIFLILIILSFSLTGCNNKKTSYTLKYELLNNDTYAIIGFDMQFINSKKFDLTIPEYYNGKPVTLIHSLRPSINLISSISIPKSISTLGSKYYSDQKYSQINEVFFFASSLIEINIDAENEIYSSNDGVLYSKDKKTLLHYPKGKENDTFNIPDGVVEVKGDAFSSANLKVINVPESITFFHFNNSWNYSLEKINVNINNGIYSSIDGVLFDKEKTVLLNYPKGRTESEYKIPSGILEISSYAFEGSHLKKLTIPNTVNTIGSFALENCNNLEEINIPNSVCNISMCAFQGCNSLEDIYIPNSVSFIGRHAFYNCNYLSIYCESSEKPIGWDDKWNITNNPVVWSSSKN